MKVFVTTGGTGFTEEDVEKAFNETEWPITKITIKGSGLRGLGLLVARYALKNGIELEKINAPSGSFDFSIIDAILSRSEGVLSFWDGSNNPTLAMINHARHNGLPIYIYPQE